MGLDHTSLDVSAGKRAQNRGKSFFPFLKRATLLQTLLVPNRIKIEIRAFSQIKEQTFEVNLSILQMIFKAS